LFFFLSQLSIVSVITKIHLNKLSQDLLQAYQISAISMHFYRSIRRVFSLSTNLWKYLWLSSGGLLLAISKKQCLVLIKKLIPSIFTVFCSNKSTFQNKQTIGNEWKKKMNNVTIHKIITIWKAVTMAVTYSSPRSNAILVLLYINYKKN